MYPTWGLSRKNYYPWRDWIMPWETLPTLLAQPWVDPQWLPQALYTWNGVYSIKTESIDAPLFIHPKGPRVLPVLDPHGAARTREGKRGGAKTEGDRQDARRTGR